MISNDVNELTANMGQAFQKQYHGKYKAMRVIVQIDAISVVPTCYYDENGRIINGVIFVEEDDEIYVKAACYMYAFLMVPLDANSRPHFICGLLST